jgi:hypothetical protein
VMRSSARGSLLVVVAMLVAMNCYNPVLVECVVACRSGADCPRPLMCQPSGFCGLNFECAPAASDSGAPDTATREDALIDDNSSVDQVGDLSGGLIEMPGPDARLDSGASIDLPSPVSPDQLPRLVLWLDGDSSISTSLGLHWGDRSPAHNDATQVPELSPIVIQNLVGSHSGLHFYGEGQYLHLPSGFADFTLGLSAFVVVRLSPPHTLGDTNSAHFFDLGGEPRSTRDSVAFMRYGVDAAGLLLRVFAPVDPWTSVAPGIVEDYVFHLYEVTLDGGAPGSTEVVSYYRDGAAATTGSAYVPDLIERTSNLIGRSNDWQGGNGPVDLDLRGDLGEIVIYSQKLADSERERVERYLMSKWLL